MSTNLRRAAMSVALAGLSVLSAAALTAAPAQASAGALRLGEHQSLAGKIWLYYDNTSSLGGAGDEASSAFNDTEDAWVLYVDSGYRDHRFCIRSGQYIRNLHTYNFGDKISSVRRLSTRSCVGYPVFE
ncbi:hypothetical protein Aple_015570 [Acrocarpospora pleiomorpha]|uniref:Beta/gamma crystallin 'Greek key' domain-containing protein n=1 Tax=Acrocarpospora pleiomorpha TaxID=90975 RepID=A0A5M3XD18_9ACTN|nr:beta/gamma crystallin-related protein [Acrocarpospora pleiomorpha]GES18662.1 hypothetical protein Aple_015570 [Acrocarpospora pleiomorpha]